MSDMTFLADGFGIRTYDEPTGVLYRLSKNIWSGAPMLLPASAIVTRRPAKIVPGMAERSGFTPRALYRAMARGLEDVADMIVLELQRCGLFRTGYEGTTLPTRTGAALTPRRPIPQEIEIPTR